MAFDFKKEFKQIYAPAKKPSIIEVPKMNYVAVRGKGCLLYTSIFWLKKKMFIIRI